MKKGIKKIDLAIFPEINRLNYFIETTGIERKKTLLIPNTCYVQNSNTSISKHLSKVQEEHFMVLHVGSVGDKQHYFQSFVQCMKNLSNEKDIMFVFVGRTTDTIKTIINKNAINNALFIETVPHEELTSIYNRADLGVILYKGTSLNYEYCAPNKLYEFWSYGIPVIGHQLIGLKTVYDNKILGELTDFNNPKNISDCIQNIKVNRNSNGKLIKDYFSNKLSISNYLDLMNRKIKQFIQ